MVRIGGGGGLTGNISKFKTPKHYTWSTNITTAGAWNTILNKIDGVELYRFVVNQHNTETAQKNVSISITIDGVISTLDFGLDDATPTTIIGYIAVTGLIVLDYINTDKESLFLEHDQTVNTSILYATTIKIEVKFNDTPGTAQTFSSAGHYTLME